MFFPVDVNNDVPSLRSTIFSQLAGVGKSLLSPTGSKTSSQHPYQVLKVKGSSFEYVLPQIPSLETRLLFADSGEQLPMTNRPKSQMNYHIQSPADGPIGFLVKLAFSAFRFSDRYAYPHIRIRSSLRFSSPSRFAAAKLLPSSA